MVDLAQTIEEWKDIQSLKVDDQVMSAFPLMISSINVFVCSVSGRHVLLTSLRANIRKTHSWNS